MGTIRVKEVGHHINRHQRDNDHRDENTVSAGGEQARDQEVVAQVKNRASGCARPGPARSSPTEGTRPRSARSAASACTGSAARETAGCPGCVPERAETDASYRILKRTISRVSRGNSSGKRKIPAAEPGCTGCCQSFDGPFRKVHLFHVVPDGLGKHVANIFLVPDGFPDETGGKLDQRGVDHLHAGMMQQLATVALFARVNVQLTLLQQHFPIFHFLKLSRLSAPMISTNVWEGNCSCR